MTPGLRPHTRRRLTMAALLVVMVAAAAAVATQDRQADRLEARRRQTALQVRARRVAREPPA